MFLYNTQQQKTEGLLGTSGKEKKRGRYHSKSGGFHKKKPFPFQVKQLDTRRAESAAAHQCIGTNTHLQLVIFIFMSIVIDIKQAFMSERSKKFQVTQGAEG